jgi:hypothetical protein
VGLPRESRICRPWTWTMRKDEIGSVVFASADADAKTREPSGLAS